MAENKKSILVYADWIDKFEELEDDEAGRLIKHFFRYVNDLNPEYPDRTTKLMFIDIKNTLKRDLDKWEDKSPQRVEKARLAGLASAEARKLKKQLDSTNELKAELNPTKSTISVSVSDTVSESVSETLKDKDNNSSVVISDELKIHPQGVKIDFIRFQNFFNANRGLLPEVKKMTDARKKRVSILEKQYGKELMIIAIEKARDSDFLQGHNPKNWIASFDWIFTPANFIKIIEDNYLKKQNANGKITHSNEFKQISEAIKSDGIRR